MIDRAQPDEGARARLVSVLAGQVERSADEHLVVRARQVRQHHLVRLHQPRRAVCDLTVPPAGSCAEAVQNVKGRAKWA